MLVLQLLLPIAVAHAQVVPIDRGTRSSQGVEPLPRRSQVGDVQPIESTLGDARTVRVLAIGKASVINGNVESAREAALRAAYSEAVGRGAGIAVGSLTIITNVQKVSDVVLTRSRGFVKSYRILKEGVVDGGTSYEMRIEAEVVADGVTEEDEIDGLRLYLKVLGEPRLLIMLPQYGVPGAGSPQGTAPDSADESDRLEIEYKDQGTELRVRRSDGSERRLDEAGPSRTQAPEAPAGAMRSAEAALAQAFSRYGYQVQTSDDIASRGLVPPDVLERARQGITEDAILVARAASADLALLGVLRVSSRTVKPYGVEFESVTGEASAKALIVSSGYRVDAFHTTTTKAHTSQLAASAAVLDSIAEEVASTLAWKIPGILVNHPRETRLQLDGVSIEQTELVKTRLAEMPDVEAVRVTQLPTSGNAGTAEILVLTGFVRSELDVLFDICREAIGREPRVVRADGACAGFALVDHDRYQIRLQRCDVKLL